MQNKGIVFVECLDDTLLEFHGNNYRKFVKPNAKRFVKMNTNGAISFVIVPQWYRNGNPPGTKYFNLVEAGKVLKFMSEVVESQQLPDDPQFFRGTEHCAQEEPIGIYELKEITLQELNNLFPIGGKKGKSKTTKHRKRKGTKRRSRKHRRKSRKHKRKCK